MKRTQSSVQCRAIRTDRGDLPAVFQFSLRLKDLLAVADVSRLSGVTLEDLVHYHRSDVRKSVDELTSIATSLRAPFPFPITISLSADVRFRQSRGPGVCDGTSSSGTIEIPLGGIPTKKPGLVLDGHFPLLAAILANLDELPIAIFGFLSDNEVQLREQFASLSSQRRIEPGQATQVIPEGLVSFSRDLSAKEIPQVVGDWLNQSKTSPFYGLLKGAMHRASNQKSIIPISALTRSIEESLTTPSGCLFPYRNIATNETDVEGICRVLQVFWSATKNVFPNAWGKPISKSRLMHGAGIRSMGRLMDRVMPVISMDDENAITKTEAEIQVVAPICRWTSGTWDELDIKWNELKNVPRHIAMLSSFLIRSYLRPS